MKTKFSFSKKPRTSIVHRNLQGKNVNLRPLRLPSFLGLTMGVLILTAMAAPSARAALLTYYDFENDVGVFPIVSDGGQQSTSLTFVAGGDFGVFPQTGTNVNAVTPSTNAALQFFPEADIASGPFSFKLGGLTTTGLADVNLSFAFLSGGTNSFTTLNLLYSTTGVNGPYTNFATDTTLLSNTTYTKLSFDAPAAVDGISGGNLFFEFSFTGATAGVEGSNAFIDNIQVTAVPEPTTWIGGALGIPFLGFVYIQRRRRAQMLRRA